MWQFVTKPTTVLFWGGLVACGLVHIATWPGRCSWFLATCIDRSNLGVPKPAFPLTFPNFHAKFGFKFQVWKSHLSTLSGYSPRKGVAVALEFFFTALFAQVQCFCHLENHEKSWKVTKSPQAAPRIRPAQVSAPRWAFHLQQPAPGRHQRAQTEHPNEDEKILFKKNF